MCFVLNAMKVNIIWCEICSKLTIKTPEDNKDTCFSVSIVNFKQVNSGWVKHFMAFCGRI